MAANVVTKHRSYAGDQAGSFVDIVTLDRNGDTLMIDNRSSTVHISFTYATNGGTAATPTNLGDDCFYVPAGSFRAFSGPFQANTQIKLIGSTTAMSYVVAVI